MIKFDSQYTKSSISDKEMETIRPQVEAARDKIMNGTGEGSEFLGWRDLPENYDHDEFARIKAAAARIRENSDILVVVGIGGSFLGARAVIKLLGDDRSVDVLFAGDSLGSVGLSKVLKKLEGKNWSINVISKSGTTLEPALAFRILREKLIERYGAIANRRIYVTTDASDGTLHDFAVKEGYERFVVPDNIAGRYSVLTAVGLLPIAVAGVDINALMDGAKEAKGRSIADAMDYAAIRNILYNKGLGVEILTCFEPSFSGVAEWWKQLFGESEGKNRQGILPYPMICTTDLHSLGQYCQDGKRQFFETFVNIQETPIEIIIPKDGANNEDKLDYLTGKTLSFINQQAYEATVLAHGEDDIPVMLIDIPKLNAYEIGCFIYFMEMSIALSAYTMGVNPFNQPGVETYKNHMSRLLGQRN
ncbi:glucose-6-phosphate isomerase [Candidatus Saccharibacteria bacterium]|nr:glucose-6-phosphate isomerase [Candidatus Saccharibacteria bacterium]